MATNTQAEKDVDQIIINFEGTTTTFQEAVERWQCLYQLNGQVVDAGITVALTVSRDQLGPIRDLLLAGNGPEELYRAYVPSASGRFSEIIRGTAYESENRFIEQAPGRHVYLSALPSELAKARRERSQTSETTL